MGCAASEISPQNEPPRGKSCTDVLWLVIYVIFWIAMIIVSAVSFVYGNPLRIINGFDSFGNTCGLKQNQRVIDFPLAGLNTSDKPYLFFMDMNELSASMKVCVKKCPTSNMEKLSDIQMFYRETGSNLCRYDIDLSVLPAYTANFTSPLGPCPTLPVYSSYPLLNRCVPQHAKVVAKKILNDFSELLNNFDTLEQVLSDLYSSWKEMTICVIIAFIVSLVMVSILHLLATFVSWIFMIAVSIASVVGTGLLWHTYHELRTHKGSLSSDADGYSLRESFMNEKAFLWYSIIATVITVIILLLVWVMRSRVSFLAALFKETAHCLASIPGLFLQPIITFFFLVLFFVYWSLVVVCLATAQFPDVPFHHNFFINGTPQHNQGRVVHLQSDNGTGFVTYRLDDFRFDSSWVKGMWWLCLICLVWTSEFILACQQMTIAGAVSHWYFRGPRASSSPVMYSIGKLLTYHMGSVAKGSFLITLFKVPRLIMTFLYAKLKTRADKGSECAKCGLKCGICCFYCLEKFIRYLNHNAYTVITIERVHFCKAAAIAFNTLVNNALQVATINSVGDFILFLGKCIVTAVTGSLGLLMLKRNPELHFFAAPTLVICIYSFFIAHCILSLYEMVVDTLFLCVCEDRNLNGEEGRWRDSRLAELGGGGPPPDPEDIARRKHHDLAAAATAEPDQDAGDAPDKF